MVYNCLDKQWFKIQAITMMLRNSIGKRVLTSLGVRTWGYMIGCFSSASTNKQNERLLYSKEGKREYGECKNVYIFRAKYCCEDVSLFA